MFCLHFLSSSFHPPRFYSPPYSFLPFSTVNIFWVIPIFLVLLCTPPLFLQVSLWLATFLGFFTAFVTLPAVCGRQDPGNVATLVFLFHVLYMIHLPGKKVYGDPCRSGSCGGACLSSSLCFEDIKGGGVFKLCTAKFTT